MLSIIWFLLIVGVNANIPRPKGVPIELAPVFERARSSGEFSCLDGSNTISWEFVNDDYCDCADASDEPGTSACGNGRFWCSNLGFIPVEILSSRVNDGVCDCCDGGDEFNSGVSCPNTCDAERSKSLEKFAQLNAGFKKRSLIIATAGKELETKQTRLTAVQEELELEKQKRSELEAEVTAKETPEKEAIRLAKEEFEKLKRAKELEEQRDAAEIAFHRIDSDGNNEISNAEMLACANIEAGGECNVSHDEANLWIGDTPVNFDTFLSSIWLHLKPNFQMTNTVITTTASPVADTDVEEQDFDSDEEPIDRDNDEDYETAEDNEEKAVVESTDLKIEYDEATKALIAEADAARAKLKEHNDRLSVIEGERDELSSLLEFDFGEHKEFYTLYNQCFDIDSQEYNYKVCFFKSVTQKPKNGGIETNMGRNSEWIGEKSKYDVLKFRDGTTCWNGPARSTTITMTCGETDEIVSVSEPSMCEYVMEFSTPLACNKQYDLDNISFTAHEEL